MKKILITGSCGFIFSNFVKNLDKYSNYKFVSVDKIIDSYNLRNIPTNHPFYMGDVANEQFMDNVFKIEKPNFVIHGSAQSFVDDSIKNAQVFVDSNIVATQVMVDLSLKYGVEKFHYCGTDEVYGQLQKGDEAWTEESITKPRNPYSATKLAGELIVYAASQTHGLKYNITRCANNFGPVQPPRNLIPKIITCLINNKPIPIHGNGDNYREWIYVLDHCNAIMKILEDGKDNNIYNIGSGLELSNLEVVEKISIIMNKKPQINFIKDRAGHDKRYSVNFDKLKKIGWKSEFSHFDKMINYTIQWYIDNQDFYK